jgi:hypothetical protein
MRAGDDQHGRHALNHGDVKPNGDGPGDGGQGGHGQGDVEQPAGGHIGQHLRA